MYPGKKLDDKIAQKEEYQWKVLSIEPKEHRMGLVLMDDTKLEEASKKDDTDKKEVKEVKEEKSEEKEADKK